MQEDLTAKSKCASHQELNPVIVAVGRRECDRAAMAVLWHPAWQCVVGQPQRPSQTPTVVLAPLPRLEPESCQSFPAPWVYGFPDYSGEIAAYSAGLRMPLKTTPKL